MNRLSRLLVLALTLSLTGCPSSSELSTGTQDNSSEVAADLSQDFQEIAKRMLPAVVSISTRGGNPIEMPDDPAHQGIPGQPREGVGSGVIVDAERGFVITNNHVIAGADQIQVALQNGRRMSAKVIGTDPPSDLAVIQLQNKSSLQAAVLGDSAALRVGEWVLAIGSPFGLDSTVTAGIISAKGRAEMGVADFEDFIQTDAAINPGNSGGPLVNTKGELIGINTAIATRSTGYMGVGFAIPSNMAKLVMQELITKGKVTRSQLGVYIDTLDEDLRQALKLPADQKGILVTQVIPGTPAAAGGFQKYDLIISLEGQPVTQVQAFRNQIALTPPGRKLNISVRRNGQTLTLNPTLREMAADALSPTGGIDKRLGFTLESISQEQRSQLGLPDSFNGLIVSEIDTGSNAYRRGVRQGDLVTEVNRQKVTLPEEIAPAIANAKPGDAILLNIIRDGQTRILAFELQE